MGDSVAEYRSRPTLRPDPRQCSIPVSLRSSIVSHSYTKLKSRIRACEPQLGWLQWLLMYTLCLFESQPPPSHIYIVIGITADWHDDFREVVRQPGSGMLHIQGKRTFLLASMSDLIELLRWLRKDQKYVGFFHVLIAVEGPCRLDWPTIGYDMGLIRFYGCQDSEGKELVHLYTQSNQADVADIFHDICIKPIVELPDPPLVDSPTEPVQPLAFHVHKHVHMAPAYPASSPESSPPAGGIFESLAAAERTSAPRPKLSSLSSIAAHGRSRRAESFAVASGLLDAKGPTRRASPVVASSSTRTASPEHGELHGARQNTDDEERFYPRIDATIRHLDQRKDNYSAPLKVFIVDTGASKEAPRGTSKCARRVRAAWKHLSRIDSATTKKVHLKSDRAKDRIGHGTNVAALFHKYGPSAEVWVCKVVEDIPDDKDGGYQYTIDPKAVADALQSANEHDADIIIMSLGFPDEQQPIEDALRAIEARNDHKRRHTYVFAATSNDGLVTRPISWPARRAGVYGISAASLHGLPHDQAPFSGSSEMPPLYFSYGTQVQLFGTDGIPQHEKGGAASWATPILAGLVATILHLTRSYASDDTRELAKAVHEYVETFGLDPVFRAKSKKPNSGRHEFLLLHEIFERQSNSAGDRRLDQIDIVLENLHNIYVSFMHNKSRGSRVDTHHAD